MRKVFILQAEHFYIDGRPLTAHATIESCGREAAELVNLITTDANRTYDWTLPIDATPETWEAALKRLHEKMIAEQHADDEEAAQTETDVWVMEVELQGEAEPAAPPMPEVRHVYYGSRDATDITRVTVQKPGEPPVQLDPRLDLVDHSPTGFEWGYLGSGPAQLALAILAHELSGQPDGPEMAVRLHHRFKYEVIGELSRGIGWVMTTQDINDWLLVVSEQQEQQAPKQLPEIEIRARLAGIRDMDNWSRADMDRWSHDNGWDLDHAMKTTDVRRHIIDVLDRSRAWVAFCQLRGVAISPVPA